MEHYGEPGSEGATKAFDKLQQSVRKPCSEQNANPY